MAKEFDSIERFGDLFISLLRLDIIYRHFCGRIVDILTDRNRVNTLRRAAAGYEGFSTAAKTKLNAG
jgi:hypothetical protein